MLWYLYDGYTVVNVFETLEAALDALRQRGKGTIRPR
jgi:hypothetical protein